MSELRFELQPLTSPETCFPSHRSKWVCEYFSSEDLHAELGKTLGRTAKDVGNSLTVDPFGDSYDQFTLRAEGKDGDEAGVLASAALARFEGYLIESRQRCNELSLAQIERQIEEQKLKVEAAKAKMDAAFEKLKSAQSEDR